MDAGGVRLFIKDEQCFQIATHCPKKITEEVYLWSTKKIDQRSQRRICYMHMAPRKSQLIWVCQY